LSGVVKPAGRIERDDDAPSPYEAAWEAVRAGLKRSVGARTFDGWLKPVTLVGFDAEAATVRLAAPSDFMANWVDTHFAEQLLAAWRAMLPQVAKVSIAAGADAPKPALFVVAETASESIDEPEDMPVAVAVPGHSSSFEARYSFDAFVVGKANEVAYNAAKTMAEGGTLGFNPLFPDWARRT
jgi:chromosomal replication initiator protein